MTMETRDEWQPLAVSMPETVIGAEIAGVDLSKPLGDDTFGKVESLFNERSVLCFRGQSLAENELIDFASRFGRVEPAVPARPAWSPPGYPEIMRISNIKKDGRDIGHSDAGSVWHSDMSFTQFPPRATVLFAIEVPTRDGVALGDTSFASACAAYDALPLETKDRIENLEVVHDVFGRRAKSGTSKEYNQERKKQPNVAHPFVRVNPHTGRKALYVSPGECVGIVGVDDAVALPLIEELAGFIPQDRFSYRHKWQKGDVVIWDNGAVQHRATFDYEWPRERRLLWRVTIGDDTALGAPS